MNLIQITPGAGPMYCGNCLRDNALIAALRAAGHEALMVPLYLPLTLDEPDQSSQTPIFFGGINVYLGQRSTWFRGAPRWLHQLLNARPLLRWAAGRAAKTRPADVGELTLSMLRGEKGNQARQLDELIAFLKGEPKPEVIFLSNALLLGMARRLKAELGGAVACMLQGEDWFLDGLPEPYRTACSQVLVQRAREVDFFVAPSRYYAGVMETRLELDPGRVRVVPNGIDLAGYPEAGADQPIPPVPTLGFFTRMCREKGLDILVEAFIRLRQTGRWNHLRLRVGGSCGPADQPLVDLLRQRLRTAGYLAHAEFHPNLDRARKIEFLKSLTVFSVPAAYSEAFGLYVIEALAAGVPVVQPRCGAFTELVETTGGGLLCAPRDADSLAQTIETLLKDPGSARALGRAGQRCVLETYSSEAMARDLAGYLKKELARPRPVAR